MAFNFNGIKATSVASYTAQMYNHLAPLAHCDMHSDEAKKQGDIGLQFYYYFLKRLYEAASPNNSTLSRYMIHMLNRPKDTLKGLQEIADFDKEYIPSDVDAIKRVIEVMQMTTV